MAYHQGASFSCFPGAEPVLQVERDPLADLAAASGEFHELTARLLLEHERVLAHNGELRAELARLRAMPWGAPVEVEEELARLEMPPSPLAWQSHPTEPHEVSLNVVAELENGAGAEEEEEEPVAQTRTAKSAKSAKSGGKISGESCSENSPRWALKGDEEKPRRNSLASMSSGVSAAVRRLSSNGRPLTEAMVLAYRFLEDADSGPMARRYKAFMQMMLFISVGTPLMQMSEHPILPDLPGAIVETFFDVVFTIELLARFIVTPAPRIFFTNGFNMIDLVTPTTLTVRTIVGFGVVSVDELRNSTRILLLCLTPIFRLLKMLRRWETIHLLTKAFVDVFEALPVLLFPLLMLTLTFAALIYMVEPRSNVPSLPKALWFTIVTMTTVGYGDVYPISTPGSLITSVLVISSIMYMAMPVAILGSSFTRVWQERDSVMLFHRTRKRLAQWGYTVNDIPRLFEAFTGGDSGELNIPEFVRMIKAMKLGLNDERIMQLFSYFDSDRSGTIDDREFVRHLYPSKFVEVYGMMVGGEIESEQVSPRVN